MCVVVTEIVTVVLMSIVVQLEGEESQNHRSPAQGTKAEEEVVVGLVAMVLVRMVVFSWAEGAVVQFGFLLPR